jgi:hypothetical protein
MLTRKATRPMIALWKRTWAEYRDRLKLGRKSGAEILAYLREKYPLEEIVDDSAKRVVLENARSVEPLLGRLADSEVLEAVVFLVRDESVGHELYELQDRVFQSVPIFVGVERTTGFFHVEGSSRLWDELNAFRGVDEADLTNFYRVSEYVTSLRRFGLLESALR